MAQIKISKAELHEGEFAEGGEHIALWLRANSRTILAAIVVVLAVYLGVAFYQGRQQMTLIAANDQLSIAADDFQKAISEQKWASPDRKQALKKVADSARLVQEAFQGTAAARQATFLEANAYYEMGDEVPGTAAPNTEQALTVFSRYLAEAKTPFEKAKADLAIAYCHENAAFIIVGGTNDAHFKDALASFQKVIDNKDAGFLRYEAMLGLGRLKERQKDYEGAEKLYRMVMADRFEPVEKPATEDNPNEQVLYFLKSRSAGFTLAGTARVRLADLGVDVDKEYPAEKVAPQEETGRRRRRS